MLVKKIMVMHDREAVNKGKYDLEKESYSYLTDIEDIAVGNIVVVDNKNGLTLGVVAQVKGLTEGQQLNAAKWVVDRVDMDAHTARLESFVRIQELKNKIAARRKLIEEMHVLKMMAAEDPEMREALLELYEHEPNAVPPAVLSSLSRPASQETAHTVVEDRSHGVTAEETDRDIFEVTPRTNKREN